MQQSDLFVSYRRRDKPFVRQLETALTTHGREVWVDWEDIPPGSVDFTQDIERGIEGSDAFVPVLTPDFFDSPHCMAELAHAVNVGKRIVPLVASPLDDVVVPDSIAHINWVYFTPHAGEANAFDTALSNLLEALDTDHEYVRQHTWLMMRARAWERAARDEAYLLSGAELVDAERWRSDGVDKQPALTPLHVDYLLSSGQAEVARSAAEQKLQRQARDRLRLLIGLLVAGIALVLGGLAWFYFTADRTVSTLAEDNLVTALEVAAAGISGDEFVALITQGRPRADGLTDDPRYWEIVQFLNNALGQSPDLQAYTYTQDARTGDLFIVADATASAASRWTGGFLQLLEVPAWDVDKFVEGFRRTVIYENRFTDARGTFVSGYTPIRDSRGRVVGGLAIDMLVDRYLALPRQIGNTGLIVVGVLLVAGVSGGIVYAVYRQRQRSQDAV